MMLKNKLKKIKEIKLCSSFHFEFFLVIVLIVFFLTTKLGYSEELKYFYLKIDLNRKSIEELQIIGFDLSHSLVKSGYYAELIADQNEVELLNKSGFKFEIIQNDYENFLSKKLKYEPNLKLADDDFKLGSWAGYFNPNEIDNEFKNFTSKYPNFSSQGVSIGKSTEGREIFSYCFGDCDGQSPEVLITSLHHAREPGSVSTVIFFLRNLLRKASEGDKEANYLLTHRKLFVVPVVNPDGYAYNFKMKPEGGGLWRKNRFKVNDSTYGVDINRNYGPYEYWNAPNFGSSTDPKAENYRGSEPFSEIETKNMKLFVESHNFVAALNYHTYSNLLIYPFGATKTETQDSFKFRDLAYYLTSNNILLTGRDLQTVNYYSRGNSDDWMYTVTPEKNKIFAMTPEIGTLKDGFWTTPYRIIKHGKDNLFMNYQLLWAGGYHIKPISIEVKKDTLVTLQIKVKNLGLKDFSGNAILQFNSLDSRFSLLDNQKILENLKSFEDITYNLTVKFTNGNFVNGLSSKIEVKTNIDNFSYSDTLETRLINSENISLFANGVLLSDWDKGSWGTVYDNDLKEFVLTDSPNGLYKDSSSNYLTMTLPIYLNYKAAYLELETKFAFEPQFDYAIIEISSDFGKTWNNLRTSRMVEGSGADGARLDTTKFGFTGTVPFWLNQSYSLEKYLNRNIMLRLAVLSDKGNNLDGWLINNLKIKYYPIEDIPLFVAETLDDTSEIVITSNQNSVTAIIKSSGNANLKCVYFKLYDLLGNLITTKQAEDNIFTQQNLTTGIYNLTANYNGNLYRKSFIIY